ECLRFAPPAIGNWRILTKDAQIGGVDIPSGARLFWVFAAANRDDSVFEDQNTFDIERANTNKHLTFSRGAHRCMGASLAPMMVEVGLSALLNHLTDLELADEGEPHYEPAFSVRVPSALTVVSPAGAVR